LNESGKKRKKGLARDANTIGGYYNAWDNFDVVSLKISSIYSKGCRT